MATFVDRVVLHLQAGDGGHGCVSVRREKFKPLGGPDGGDGGHGGGITLVVDPQQHTLLDFHFHPHVKAPGGTGGMGANRDGAKGKDLVLQVPDGTVVQTLEGEVIADMVGEGTTFEVARGGRGGRGNASLANARRKVPGFAELGEPGDRLDVVLELKSVADVGLVGFPSAGKSSLIAVMSAAKPKIADYPFTTLVPNLGVVQAGDVRYTIADVPGLIEGASEGKGLGLDFLRHVERCTALLHVLDCATLEPGRDPLTDLDIILKELGAYDVPGGQIPLLERPQLVALNKVDVPEARELAEMVRPELEARGYRVFEISAVSHDGLRQLSFALGETVDEHRTAVEEAEKVAPRIVMRPRRRNEKEYVVKVEGGTHGDIFRVLGQKPERWVQQTDFTNDEAVGYLADRLAKIGVEDGLFAAGAAAGATVVIGPGDGVIFDWEPTLTSTAELMTAPRGTDSRLDENSRPTHITRRQQYLDRMDAKAEARAELEREREAGFWDSDNDVRGDAARDAAHAALTKDVAAKEDAE